MDQIEKFWLFCSWLEDYETQSELLKHHAILTGSFSNPEMAKRMAGSKSYKSSDEDFEKSWETVKSSELHPEAKAKAALLGIDSSGKKLGKRRKVIK